MVQKIKATIRYNTDAQHPDTNGRALNNQEYTDVYTINTDYFYGPEDIQDYIKQDLLLVAGGGYDWKHINNYKFTLRSV